MKQENFKILTNEELRKICGGRSFSSINSELQGNSEVFNRKSTLATAQKITREAAIYYKGARGINDNASTKEDTTWCNQSSYDIMEATGVHMEAFYGDDGKKYGIKRGAGEWVNANKACDNVEKYIDSHARHCRIKLTECSVRSSL